MKIIVLWLVALTVWVYIQTQAISALNKENETTSRALVALIEGLRLHQLNHKKQNDAVKPDDDAIKSDWRFP